MRRVAGVCYAVRTCQRTGRGHRRWSTARHAISFLHSPVPSLQPPVWNLPRADACSGARRRCRGAARTPLTPMLSPAPPASASRRSLPLPSPPLPPSLSRLPSLPLPPPSISLHSTPPFSHTSSLQPPPRLRPHGVLCHAVYALRRYAMLCHAASSCALALRAVRLCDANNSLAQTQALPNSPGTVLAAPSQTQSRPASINLGAGQHTRCLDKRPCSHPRAQFPALRSRNAASVCVCV